MLSYIDYTKTSFQRCLFGNILVIYITFTDTYYKHNTDFCYTVIFIKNSQKDQNLCCVIGSSVSVSPFLLSFDDSTAFWVFGLFGLLHCCLHLQKLQHSTFFSLQMHTCFFYKHNAYKHIQPGISEKNKHMLGIVPSLKNNCSFFYLFQISFRGIFRTMSNI